jgi:transcriptional regulator with XRE-family HTH domain
LGVKNKVGAKIRQLRSMSGLSQDNVADEIGMSAGNFGKIERGEIDVDSSHLIKIAKVLKINVAEFFEDTIKPTIKDPKPEYGFATKEDLVIITNAIKILAEQVEKLSERLPKYKASTKKGYSKK